MIDAESALARVRRLCDYLDTSAVTMSGKIVHGHADPETIRMALEGGPAWDTFEARIALLPPGGVAPAMRERIANLAPGDSVDIGAGAILSCD